MGLLERGGRPLVVFVLGSTASGKSGMGVRLARRWGFDVVSADSRQVFSELRIGSAAPSAAEMEGVVHHLVGHRSVLEAYSAGEYEREALEVILGLHGSGRGVVVVGGSMLYVEALCWGLDAFPEPDEGLRCELNARLLREGVEALGSALSRLDPETWSRIDRRNGARIVRALEVTLQSGRPYSSFLAGRRERRGGAVDADSGVISGCRPFDIVRVGLLREDDELRDRIGLRVEAMVEAGLEEEVRGLQAWRDRPALKSVGYSEFFDYFDGVRSYGETLDRIRVNTWRYAKRQRTWWRRDGGIRWFGAEDEEGIAGYVASVADGWIV